MLTLNLSAKSGIYSVLDMTNMYLVHSAKISRNQLQKIVV